MNGFCLTFQISSERNSPVAPIITATFKAFIDIFSMMLRFMIFPEFFVFNLSVKTISIFLNLTSYVQMGNQ